MDPGSCIAPGVIFFMLRIISMFAGQSGSRTTAAGVEHKGSSEKVGATEELPVPILDTHRVFASACRQAWSLSDRINGCTLPRPPR